MKKKVILIVIDAFASRILMPALEAGELPTFARLINAGVLRRDCTSIFPSITPAATASIATGVYPTDHHIAGAFWYDREKDCVAYYGDDFWVIMHEGMDEFFNDFLVRLNHGRLHANTLYERVERSGQTAAALNYMWFRGETRHDVNAPLLLRLFPGFTFAPQIKGPTVLAMADFATSKVPGRDEWLKAKGGMQRRYGFHDDTTAGYLKQMATANPFPDFTIAYFPNNDFVSHQQGPEEALSAIKGVDGHLQEFIDAMGGLDTFLQSHAMLITGDHSQSDLLADEGGRGINVCALLEDYKHAEPGTPWQSDDDIMVCPNMRACHIYLQSRADDARDRVIERLLSDPRVDQVFWRASAWEEGNATESVDPRTDTFHIATADRGRLAFHHTTDGEEAQGTDIYGSRWSWEGNLDCVDATVRDGQIRYREYPNALERISTGFTHLAEDLWVTARVGCEFKIEETSIHGGGSHGALNKDDSTAPLILAGIPDGVTIPEHPRTIDVAPLCLRTLGLDDEADDLIESRHAGNPA